MTENRETNQTAKLTAAMAVRATLQIGLFFITAKMLGVDTFGTLVTILALSSILAPLSSLGLDYLVVRTLSRNPHRNSRVVGNSLFITIVNGFLLSLFTAYIITAYFEQSSPFIVYLCIVAIEILILRLLEITARILQSKSKITLLSIQRLLVPFVRFSSLSVLYLSVDTVSLDQWAMINGISTIACASLILMYVHVNVFPLKPSSKRIISKLKHSHLFLWGAFTYRISNDADKIILTSIINSSITGIYGAAYRVVEMALLPSQALLTVSTQKIYSDFSTSKIIGCKTISNTVRKNLVINTIIIVALCISAPLIPLILGHDFELSTNVIYWLCALPLISSSRSIYSLALQAANKHGVNSTILATMSCASIPLTIYLVLSTGWIGAVYATLTTELCTLILVKLALYNNVRKRDD